MYTEYHTHLPLLANTIIMLRKEDNKLRVVLLEFLLAHDRSRMPGFMNEFTIECCDLVV